MTNQKAASFADVALGTLSFDATKPSDALILSLIDTMWVQRLRHVKQTGNTHLVYMFAEHSRFGHSLGVAYLSLLLMENLSKAEPALVEPYHAAVSVAALLHDIGHVAPGSHLASQVWAPDTDDAHEQVSIRIIKEDEKINRLLRAHSAELPDLVVKILSEDESLPAWTRAVITGGGWNADRGNWTMVDSAMCSVSYGKYNVRALIDAFRLLPDGRLAIQESRLDALTHFFVARDSMYRQVYQHRVLQAADVLTVSIVRRIRDILAEASLPATSALAKLDIYSDEVMRQVLATQEYSTELPLESLYQMTESWWHYHVERWCSCKDITLRDLSDRLRNRRLLKTIRLNYGYRGDDAAGEKEDSLLTEEATRIARELGYDPRYYVVVVDSADKHRAKREDSPLVILENGVIEEASAVEPMIGTLMKPPQLARRWLAVPKKVKETLGRIR